MAMSCEQIDEQMIDFLYGELSPDARAAFEAHLPGCDRCRREVESFGDTRALARAGLDEAPPPHLRARIVAAARAALPATATATATATEAETETATAVPPPDQRAPARLLPARPPKRGGFWDRVRAWWALPTLATVGALAVFLLASRGILDVDQVRERVALRGGTPASSEAPPLGQEKKEAREVATAAPPAQQVTEPAPAPREVAKAGANAAVAFDRQAPASRHRAARARAPASAAKSIAASEDAGDVDLGGLGAGPAKRGTSAGADRRAPGKKAFRDDSAEGDKLAGGHPGGGSAAAPAAEAAPAPTVSAKPRASLDDLLSGDLSSSKGKARAAAPEPIGRVARQAAPKPEDPMAEEERASPQAARSDRESSAFDEEAPVRRPMSTASGKGYPAPAAPPVASAAAPAPAPPPPPPAPATSAPRERLESKKARKAKKDPVADAQPDAPHAETLVQRADRLFTEGRWIEAAVAYRDLLRQSPGSPDAPRWRRRLAAAESAIKSRPPPP
ncbi:MAG TPA: zf-HC2 domain-containing protein [Polyangia bacterium]|jgi:anti-sigma factor RsiW|nr:zf-HC2 domain-containing protein [Polyangia bacterium]